MLGSRWRKPHRSFSNGNCVEIRRWRQFLFRRPAAIQVRDSKDRGGPVLSFSPGAWQAFLDATRAGP